MRNKILMFICFAFLSQVSIAQKIGSNVILSKKANKIIKKYSSFIKQNDGFSIWEININKWSQEHFQITDQFGKQHTFKADKIKKNGEHISWFGKNLKNNKFSHFSMNPTTGAVYGSLRLTDGAYRIIAIDKAKVLLIKEQLFNNYQCITQKPSIDIPSQKLNISNRRSAPTMDCNLRLIIAMTTSVAGDSFDAKTWIRNQLDLANLSYANSWIDFELEIAHVYETTYTESMTREDICWIDGIPHPSTTTDLCRFHHTGDGYMEEVHGLRDKYKADACILVVSNLPNAGGQSFLPPIINQGEAFAVLSLTQGSDYVLGHEVGHIQGCHHEYAQDPTATNNHGYVHVGTTVDNSFRTVMAYGIPCENEFGENCDRIPYFSHPLIRYNGVPVGETDPAGIDGARNAENIMNQKALILGFRNYPYNYAMPNDLVDDVEFVYTAAENEWTNALNYQIKDESTVYIYSQNKVKLKPGFHAKTGTKTQAKIEQNCSPPDY
jgi:hypothetical protein